MRWTPHVNHNVICIHCGRQPTHFLFKKKINKENTKIHHQTHRFPPPIILPYIRSFIQYSENYVNHFEMRGNHKNKHKNLIIKLPTMHPWCRNDRQGIPISRYHPHLKVYNWCFIWWLSPIHESNPPWWGASQMRILPESSTTNPLTPSFLVATSPPWSLQY